MAIYIVGDVQGCFAELSDLLKQANFSPECDELWLTGDLVARGPDSLETLLFLYGMGDCVKAVLGNHDLHLLAIYYGIRQAKPNDKLEQLLKSAHIDKLINWLRQQPLLREFPDNSSVMTHAGISPQWTISQAKLQANFVEQRLAGDDCSYWLKHMYGASPNSWKNVKTEIEQFRFSVNALTRMRFCFEDGSLEFKHKAANADDNIKLKPWFDLLTLDKPCTIYFGHWAALLGNTNKKQVVALDTGCVWGNHMTMLRWSDKKRFVAPAITR